MNTSNIFQKAATNALATAVYVTVVGLFMSHASSIFGEHDKVVTPVVVLMLLVLSAAVTGSLLFGAPAMYYVDGKKKEALLRPIVHLSINRHHKPELTFNWQAAKRT